MFINISKKCINCFISGKKNCSQNIFRKKTNTFFISDNLQESCCGYKGWSRPQETGNGSEDNFIFPVCAVKKPNLQATGYYTCDTIEPAVLRTSKVQHGPKLKDRWQIKTHCQDNRNNRKEKSQSSATGKESQTDLSSSRTI